MPQLPLASERSQGYRWLTAGEAADYLKVKARTLLCWVRQGKIKGYALSVPRLFSDVLLSPNRPKRLERIKKVCPLKTIEN